MRTNNTFLMLLALVPVVLVSCQKDTEISVAQAEHFVKYFGGSAVDRATSVIETNNGGFAFTGTMSVGDDKTKAYLVTTDNFGNGTGAMPVFFGDTLRSAGNCIIKTSSGGFLVVGYSEIFSGNRQNKDWLVVKLSAEGNILWEKKFGGDNDDEAYRVIETDNKFLVVGYTMSKGLGRADAWAMMLDQNGTVIWSQTRGGGFDDSYKSVIEKDNSYILVGLTESWKNGVDDRSVFFVKIDKASSTGDPSDFNFFGGVANGSDIKMVEKDNSLYVIRNVPATSGTSTVISILKVGLGFNLIWDKSVSGPNETFGTLLKNGNSLVVIGNSIVNGQSDFFQKTVGTDGVVSIPQIESVQGNQIQYDAVFAADGRLVLAGTSVIDNYSKISLIKLK